jgi:hypothetical protein
VFRSDGTIELAHDQIHRTKSKNPQPRTSSHLVDRIATVSHSSKGDLFKIPINIVLDLPIFRPQVTNLGALSTDNMYETDLLMYEYTASVLHTDHISKSLALALVEFTVEHLNLEGLHNVVQDQTSTKNGAKKHGKSKQSNVKELKETFSRAHRIAEEIKYVF